MKKLMYSATRVIRQELATVYRAKFGIFDGRYGSDGSISGLDRSGSEGVGEGEGGVVGEMKEKAVIDLEFDDDLKAVDKVVENEVEVPVSGVVKVVSDKAYAAGRRIQKEMSDVSEFKEAQGPVGAGCSTYSSFMNKTLDILDIGCGTGGAGAWLKDYARNLVGVDLSENMVTLARKKMIYQELHVQPFSTYLQSSSKTFDLVVAADVLSYLGDLNKSFEEVRDSFILSIHVFSYLFISVFIHLFIYFKYLLFDLLIDTFIHPHIFLCFHSPTHLFCHFIYLFLFFYLFSILRCLVFFVLEVILFSR